jgi:two-component sensor histidine kinase/CheY-like chemotaxis protein
MRIIVVDDNPDDRHLVLHQLGALYPEAETFECSDSAALEHLLREPPDLVVTDLALKSTDGRQIFSQVRSKYPQCPVIMFTGSGDETVAVELMKAGLDDYVVKSPRQLHRLRTSIQVVLEAARTRAALSRKEVELEAALAHKTLLVRELHHRVKNNIQLIISILLLRSRHSAPPVRSALEEIAGRMHALAKVQARIYETEELDSVDLSAALKDIVESLARAYADGRIRVDLSLDSMDMPVGSAMPLALLCYEFILNAFKHAWPEDRPGALAVRLDAAKGIIEVVDDGIGFAPELRTGGLGSRLMTGLAAEAMVKMDIASRPGSGSSLRIELT